MSILRSVAQLQRLSTQLTRPVRRRKALNARPSPDTAPHPCSFRRQPGCVAPAARQSAGTGSAGWSVPRMTLRLLTLSRMASTVVVHTNDVGSAL